MTSNGCRATVDCPGCGETAVIGHGRRRRQAHDRGHDSIRIRRGICNHCQRTLTVLPPWCMPGHNDLPARTTVPGAGDVVPKSTEVFRRRSRGLPWTVSRPSDIRRDPHILGWLEHLWMRRTGSGSAGRSRFPSTPWIASRRRYSAPRSDAAPAGDARNRSSTRIEAERRPVTASASAGGRRVVASRVLAEHADQSLLRRPEKQPRIGRPGHVCFLRDEDFELTPG